MRLFINSMSTRTSTTWDMEDKTDTNLVDDEYNEIVQDTIFYDAGPDAWRIENTPTAAAHGGSASSSINPPDNDHSEYSYSLLSNEQTDVIELEWYWYWDGEKGDTTVYWVNKMGLYMDANNYFWTNLHLANDGGVDKYRASIGGKTNGDGITAYWFVSDSWVNYTKAWQGFKIAIYKTENKARLFRDETNAGVWTLIKSVSLNTAFTVAKVYIDFSAGDYDPGDFAYDHFYLDDIKLTPTGGAGGATEITDIEPGECSKRLEGNGAFSFSKRDLELANYSTYKDYIWLPVEVWNNTLSKCLGEYYLIRPEFTYNKVFFRGPEALKILDRITARYNGILASGETTAVGASTIDDANAAFTDDLLTKICFFADRVGPSEETSFPDATSDHLKEADDGGATLYKEFGNYGSLATEDDNHWDAYFQKTVEGEFFYLRLDFGITNGAAATAFDLRLVLNTDYDLDTDASLHIYDDTNTIWRKVDDLPAQMEDYVFTMDEGDLPAGVIADYYTGDSPPELRFKIKSGENATAAETLRIRTVYAELKTAYTTTFSAEASQYVIDARTATQLTFTGQTPQADGVAIGDRYKVGDYLHTVLSNCFAGGFSSNLKLNCDDSTIADAADYRSAFIGDILRNYATLMKRNYWQKIGWEVEIPSSYGDTGLDLTEADFHTDPELEGWWLTRDGDEIYRHVEVLGDGCYAEGWQTPTYKSPQSLIINENRLGSQATAVQYVTNLLSAHQGAKSSIRFTLDMDGSTDYTAIDIGKTVDIDLYSGTITITAGIITEIYYTQTKGGNLFAELVVQEQ